MERDDLADLLPLALGHDQEASVCPWVQITGRTADYPSRKAQAAMAVDRGILPVTPDLVDLLYRCDDCGLCRAASILTPPVDLPRALWRVRESLVAAGEVPEVETLAATFRQHGNVYGDLGQAVARLGSGDGGADILFVPGSAALSMTPDATRAALQSVQSVLGRVDLQPDLIDSGHTLRELGLSGEAGAERQRLRNRIGEAGYREVVAGTPKEAFGLREALAGLPVEVRYAGGVVTDDQRTGSHVDEVSAVVFHPSETLLHRLGEFEAMDQWLAGVLGERYCQEPEPRRNAWPAAIERPAIGVRPTMARTLAEQRLGQLLATANRCRGGPPCPPWLKVGDAAIEPGRTRRSAPTDVTQPAPLTILTTDPYSWRALREVAPPAVEVVDLLVFLERDTGS